MATRNVLFGWGGKCMELNASDASALVDSGMCRASLTQWGGELADATVLMFRGEYLMMTGFHQDSEEAHAEAWRTVQALPTFNAREFEITTPVPVGQ